MTEEERGGTGGGSGPLAHPDDGRPREPRWAWAVSLAVVVLGLMLYAFTRSPGSARLGHRPAPAWGTLTLAQVARAQARAAGEKHPREAVWVAARRADALQLLTGQPGDSPEADYVVALRGHFRMDSGPDWLPGSLAAGPRLVLIVRAFDGTVDGRAITPDPGPDLSRLGPLQSLRLGWL